MALLSRRLNDIKDWLSLTFEVKSAAAISEIGIVGNVEVGAVVTTWGFFSWFCIHKSAGANFKLTISRSSLCSNWVGQSHGHVHKAPINAN